MARPLRRLIQSSIENPIAILIINKTFIAGDKILIDYDETKEEFVFTKAVSNAADAKSNTNQVNSQAQSQPGQIPQSQPQDQQTTQPPPNQNNSQGILSDQIPNQAAPAANANPNPPTDGLSNAKANGITQQV